MPPISRVFVLYNNDDDDSDNNNDSDNDYDNNDQLLNYIALFIIQ